MKKTKSINAHDIEPIIDAYHSGEITIEYVVDWQYLNGSNTIRLEPNPYKLWIHAYENTTTGLTYLYARDSALSSSGYHYILAEPGIHYLNIRISLNESKITTQIDGTTSTRTFTNSELSSIDITYLYGGLTYNSAVGAVRCYNRKLTDEEL